MTNAVKPVEGPVHEEYGSYAGPSLGTICHGHDSEDEKVTMAF